ncbi:DJ-1/PfpI family protein [Leptospira limi]|uniref:DJ-1/PfpI family protein n=1 Tax=Leptospira limi TaxID=2950023 RepID=A0ABT3M0C7_9LEPT|nr:DJ-1/PfpI family protein [Leptospira limi]MCW7463421.1 DJ-1/PfpI family protein [Leptospira limi]
MNRNLSQNQDNNRKINLIQSLTVRVLLSILMFGIFYTHLLANPFVSKKKYLNQIPIKSQHKKPVITIISDNEFTELTDFLVPYGILKRAGISELYALAPERGKVQLFPALAVEVDTSFANFDKEHPEGADIVIVPALHNSQNPTILNWLKKQNEMGATFIGICDGVWTLAYSGLLDQREATGHWYAKDKLIETFPNTNWTKNKRYVHDERIITTSGVTASIPISLALIETLVGKKKATEMAMLYGVESWDPEHNSDRFEFKWNHYFIATKNYLSFWNHDTIGIPIEEGMDEVSLALVADAYARTYRSNVSSIALQTKQVKLKSGISIYPDRTNSQSEGIHVKVLIPNDGKALPLLKETLDTIQKRYGGTTMEFVSLQMEFPIP